MKPDTEEKLYDTPLGKLPSVTQILSFYDNGKSGALMGWSVKVMAEYLKSLANEQGDIVIKQADADDIFRKAKAYHKELKEKAAELGSEVHNLIEVYFKNQRVDGLLEANPLLVKPFEAFKTWQAQYKFELIASERQVYSELRFAGTLDVIMKDQDNKLWVIDFKTSSGFYNTFLWQIAAYRECVMNGMYYDSEKKEWVESNLEIEGGVGILRLDKITGMPEWKPYTILEAINGFDCFMALCHLYYLTHNGNGNGRSAS